MSDSKPVPSDLNAFKGSSFAVGATRWMTPITIVPWPNAAYLLPSRMAADEWSQIAALDWFTLAGGGQVVELQGGGGYTGKSVGTKSFSSEAPARFRVKSYPASRTPCNAGCPGSTPVSMSATI